MIKYNNKEYENATIVVEKLFRPMWFPFIVSTVKVTTIRLHFRKNIGEKTKTTGYIVNTYDEERYGWKNGKKTWKEVVWETWDQVRNPLLPSTS